MYILGKQHCGVHLGAIARPLGADKEHTRERHKPFIPYRFWQDLYLHGMSVLGELRKHFGRYKHRHGTAHNLTVIITLLRKFLATANRNND